MPLNDLLPYALNLSALGWISEDKYLQLCADNKVFRFERMADGTIVLVGPREPVVEYKSTKILIELGIWNKQANLGLTFGSNAVFTLPNKALRSPDVSWISWERWLALPESDRNSFANIAPDFVVEFTSPTDRIPEVRAKMQEYLKNGTHLGWLIEPNAERLTIYRADGSTETIEGFDRNASGEDVLKGFVFDLKELR